MVREYILHDRGNSIFLGDSFGNLPSPVNEGATIKKLFKFNEDDPMEKKRKNETKNQAIRIEGKKDKNEKKEKSPERVPKAEIKMRLTEIDKIVFEDRKQLPNVLGKKVQGKKGVNDSKLSIRPYEEEESYENPVNLSKMPGLVEDYIDIKSDYVPNYLHVNNSIGISKGYVHIESLELDESIQNDYAGFKVAVTEETIKPQKGNPGGRLISEPKKPIESQQIRTDARKINDSDFKSQNKRDREIKPLSLEDSKIKDQPNALTKSHERENSSCKNTVKMTDRRDFSFVDSHRESNVPLSYNNKNLLGKRPTEIRQGKPEYQLGMWGSVNDTVSRLHGINSAQLSNKDPLYPRAEPFSVNPFIHDCQLFGTQSNTETKNFGGFLM